jgi:hypothetical protein
VPLNKHSTARAFLLFLRWWQFPKSWMLSYDMTYLSKCNFNSYLAIYFLIVLVSTVFWANQFSTFSHYKGDEFFFLVVYLLVVTILLFSIQIFIIKQLRTIVLLLIPFASVITSIILGLGVLSMTSMSGTPTQIIYVYSLVYSLTNMLVSIFFFKRLRVSQKRGL